VKNQSFDDLDKYESKLPLEIENKQLLDQMIFVKKIFQNRREELCSLLIESYMKNLLSYGITDLDISKIQSIVHIY
jgi:hypothetical protein